MSGLTEKRGVIGSQRVDQLDQRFAGCIRLHPLQVFFIALASGFTKFLAEPRAHEGLLALSQLDTDSVLNEFADSHEDTPRQQPLFLSSNNRLPDVRHATSPPKACRYRESNPPG